MAPPLLGAAQRPNSMRPQAWGYTFAPQDRPKARMAPPLLGAAQRPNSMRPQAWGSTFAPPSHPAARAPPLLGAAQRMSWPMRPQAWGSFNEPRLAAVATGEALPAAQAGGASARRERRAICRDAGA